MTVKRMDNEEERALCDECRDPYYSITINLCWTSGAGGGKAPENRRLSRRRRT
jgi:hypothetical protein